jgi:VanZ family protein
VIFGLSSIPGTQLPSVDVPQADKLAHVVVYTVLGALVFRALRPRDSSTATAPDGAPPAWRWRRALVAIALTTLYGVSDEIHQIWTPNRSSDWHDVVADLIGGGLGTVALVAMRWMKIRVCLMMERSKP